LLGLDRELILVAEDAKAAEEARMRLARVGIERVAGYVDGGITAWVAARLPLVMTQQITVQDLRDSDGDFSIIDVRRRGEWKSGHIAGAELHPLDTLAANAATLNTSRPAAVHCKSGYRSAIACSVLENAGFPNTVNVIGGYDAWAAAGLPVEV